MSAVKKTSSKKAIAAAAKPRRVELLFEIGAEEIPAGMLPRAVGELKTILEKHLAAESLTEGVTVETFGGPRRLTAWVRGLIAKQADVENEVTGPPKSVAYDNAGAADKSGGEFRGEAGRGAPRSLHREDAQGRVHRRESGEARAHGPRTPQRNPAARDPRYFLAEAR